MTSPGMVSFGRSKRSEVPFLPGSFTSVNPWVTGAVGRPEASAEASGLPGEPASGELAGATGAFSSVEPNVLQAATAKRTIDRQSQRATTPALYPDYAG